VPEVTAVDSDRELIDFGDVPENVNDLLQRGVAAYRYDRSEADSLFRQALALAPQQLPIYFCLYKIHTYQGNLDQALAAAEGGLKEAAGQAGWCAEFRAWQPVPEGHSGPKRFALNTLKALAFIRLRRGEQEEVHQILTELARLDPNGSVGWPVIASLADRVRFSDRNIKTIDERNHS
jgi:tetratricopeptide (TPR) repeat protein